MASRDDLPVELHWPGTTPNQESKANVERAQDENPRDVDHPDDSATVDDDDAFDRTGADRASTRFGDASGVIVRGNRSDRSDGASTASGEERPRVRLRLRSSRSGGPASDAQRAELLGKLERQAADLSRRIEALRR